MKKGVVFGLIVLLLVVGLYFVLKDNVYLGPEEEVVVSCETDYSNVWEIIKKSPAEFVESLESDCVVESELLLSPDEECGNVYEEGSEEPEVQIKFGDEGRVERIEINPKESVC